VVKYYSKVLFLAQRGQTGIKSPKYASLLLYVF